VIFTIGILIVCLAFIAAAIWWQYRSLACPASLIWLIENPYMNASAGLTDILVEKGLNVVPNASLDRVTDRAMYSPDGQEVPFDLIVTAPPHEGSGLIDDAGLVMDLASNVHTGTPLNPLKLTGYSWSVTITMCRPLKQARWRISRLTALVPKPRVNLTRYHGVHAPNSHHRA